MSPPAVQYIPASAVSWDALARIINRAFREYLKPVHTTPTQLQSQVSAWDIDLSSSLVAQTTRGEPVGVGLLGLRGERGWISGFAIVPERRRQGLGRRLLDQLIMEARARGVTSLALEVLTNNTPAIELYRSAGFEIRRELLGWERLPEVGALPVPPLRAEPADPRALTAAFDAWHVEPPCWQQELPSLRPFLNHLHGWAVTRNGQPIAYVLAHKRARQVTLMDVGMAPGTLARSTTRPLLQDIQLRNLNATLTLNNWPAGDPLNPVLAALGFQVRLRQYEMHLSLAGP